LGFEPEVIVLLWVVTPALTWQDLALCRFRHTLLELMHTYITTISALALLVVCSAGIAETSQDVFTAKREALYQIRVLDGPSGDRTSLGSGFAVSEHIVATNYHVISSYVKSPQRVQIELIDNLQRAHSVDIIAVDVVNDLALLRSAAALPQYLQLAQQEPAQGTVIYALGNPFDLGMSVTQGIYNGIKENSLPPRIHYSGPVNSGMSGGPSVNAAGEVVGINVATASNSVGFLVPVAQLAELLRHEWPQAMGKTEFAELMATQLLELTSTYMTELRSSDWSSEEFGGALVPGKLAPFFNCWGRSEEAEKTGVSIISRGCSNGQQVQVKNSLTTGFVEYEFAYLSTEMLSQTRLFNFAASRFRGAQPGNRAGSEDVGNFDCAEDHVEPGPVGAPSGRARVFFCTRAYQELEGLYDAFFVSFSVDREDRLLFSHFTLAGFSHDNTLEFLERFIRSLQWPSS
jgi:serine protease Do